MSNQGYLQCTGAAGCGTSGNPAKVIGNIMSVPDSFCATGNTNQSYNYYSPWGGGGGARCGTNVVGPFPTFVNASDTAQPPDLHLISGVSRTMVAAGCIATDIDGQARPTTNCTPGADQ
jgi:hypothetical protein